MFFSYIIGSNTTVKIDFFFAHNKNLQKESIYLQWYFVETIYFSNLVKYLVNVFFLKLH